jgi:RsiW-degrading membrane proteinase PrsW (M82 family)
MNPKKPFLSRTLTMVFATWFILWASYSVFKSPQPLSALVGLTFFTVVMLSGAFALKMLFLSWAEKEDFVEYTSNYIKEKVSGKSHGDKIITSEVEETLSEEDKVIWNMMIRDMENSKDEKEKPENN